MQMQKYDTGFLNRTAQISGTAYPYVVYVPDTYDSVKKWPVILFLHGAGERGNDGWRQTAYALASAIRWNPDRFDQFVVVLPQAPTEGRWLDEPAKAAMQALDRTIREFNGDEKRLYLTGLSMGGYGSWFLATEYPTRFAAVVPICGGIVPPKHLTSVRQLPITVGAENPYRAAAKAFPSDVPVWIFHGSDDESISVTESRKMAEELKHLGKNVRYTEYPGVGHNSWDQAYGDQDLWTWLAKQRRAK